MGQALSPRSGAEVALKRQTENHGPETLTPQVFWETYREYEGMTGILSFPMDKTLLGIETGMISTWYMVIIYVA